MRLYKKVLLSFSICTFLISNQVTNLPALAHVKGNAGSETSNAYFGQNLPCGIWAWEFPTDLQDPRLILEQNDPTDAEVDCRTEISIINNTGIPISTIKIFSIEVPGYTLELSTRRENSKIEWKFPYNIPETHFYAIQSLDTIFSINPIDPQQNAAIYIQGSQTTVSLANDLALFITFKLIDQYPCIPVQEAVFADINLVNQGYYHKVAQLLRNRNLGEAGRILPNEIMEFTKALLSEVSQYCFEDAVEEIIEWTIGISYAVALEMIFYSTRVIADYSRYQGSPVRLTVSYQPAFNKPDSPAEIRSLIHAIREKDLESIRKLTADNVYYTNYIEGSKTVPRDLFLTDLASRLASTPNAMP